MIEFVALTQAQTAWYDWDGALSLEIRRLTRDDLSAARRAGERVKHTGRDEAIALSLARAALVGWRGLRYRHLPEICDGVSYPSARKEEEIPYCDEAREEILARMSIALSEFLARAQDEFAAVVAAAEKNSGLGSNGGATLGD